jgi:hypothetical protein
MNRAAYRLDGGSAVLSLTDMRILLLLGMKLLETSVQRRAANRQDLFEITQRDRVSDCRAAYG